jgi:hypothetical protein
MNSLKYEIAPAYTVRVGDSVCEADGYSFEVVAIEDRAPTLKTCSMRFTFAPSDLMGRPGPTQSGWIKEMTNVRVFRKAE